MNRILALKVTEVYIWVSCTVMLVAVSTVWKQKKTTKTHVYFKINYRHESDLNFQIQRKRVVLKKQKQKQKHTYTFFSSRGQQQLGIGFPASQLALQAFSFSFHFISILWMQDFSLNLYFLIEIEQSWIMEIQKTMTFACTNAKY